MRLIDNASLNVTEQRGTRQIAQTNYAATVQMDYGVGQTSCLLRSTRNPGSFLRSEIPHAREQLGRVVREHGPTGDV
jgi:hypothetical protein